MDNPKDLEAYAKLLHGENQRNLTQAEAEAIVDSVRNRQGLQGFPSDLEGVLNQPHQFTPFSPREDPASQANAARTKAFGPDNPRWMEYITWAQGALNPERKPNPYTHYFSATAPVPPWARKMRLTRIGSHRFGTEKRKPKPKP